MVICGEGGKQDDLWFDNHVNLCMSRVGLCAYIYYLVAVVQR